MNRPTGNGSSADPEPESNSEGSVAQTLGEWLRGITGRGEDDRESLTEMLDDQLGDIAPAERAMLRNVLELADRRVGDVMVPRADIIGVDVETNLSDLVAQFRSAAHSRLPVFSGTLDEVLGFIQMRDLLEYWDRTKRFVLRKAIHDLMFVPRSMRVVDLLQRMRTSATPMAVVVDEFGGTDGLITIEDLVQEIVGEIEGDQTRAVQEFVVRPDGSILADGRASIEDLESHLKVELLPAEREEDVESLGGLLFSLVGRVPARGETIRHPSGIEFEVLDSDLRRVKRVRISPPAPATASGEATSAPKPE